MQLVFSREYSDGEYQICEAENENAIVWRRARDENENLGDHYWPQDMRAKYESLTGQLEFDPNWEGLSDKNLVEMISDNSECAWDQPCKFGYRVEDHAVYCHNAGWLYAPTKCHRRQSDSIHGSAHPHEKCPGYFPNTRFLS